jgi:hypothetical protein
MVQSSLQYEWISNHEILCNHVPFKSKIKLKILDEANQNLINDNKEDMIRNLKMKHTYNEV